MGPIVSHACIVHLHWILHLRSFHAYLEVYISQVSIKHLNSNSPGARCYDNGIRSLNTRLGPSGRGLSCESVTRMQKIGKVEGRIGRPMGRYKNLQRQYNIFHVGSCRGKPSFIDESESPIHFVVSSSFL